MTLMQRRRALMVSSGEHLARFVPGRHTGYYSSIVNEDGSITDGGSAVCYLVTIPLSAPVYYKAGDNISLVQDRNFSSLVYFRTIYIQGSSKQTIAANKPTDNYQTFTITVQEDGYFDSVRFDNSSNIQKGTVKPTFYINGKKVVG